MGIDETRLAVYRRIGATLTIAATVSAAVWVLRVEGRLWVCACGEVFLWWGEALTEHTSQHLFDPYSFTHLLHGIVLFWLMAFAAPRLWPAWQLTLAIFIESLWEIIENAPFIIQRYRTATAALGYEGDTVLNSIGDILVCAVGFQVARYLGVRWSVGLFVLTEGALLVLIRDSLLLNVVMLLYPIEALRVWQMGG